MPSLTDEEQEILELRYHNRDLSEQLAYALAEAKKYEEMYETLGARYARAKARFELLWQEYCLLKVAQED
jgi:hypothetical protein